MRLLTVLLAAAAVAVPTAAPAQNAAPGATYESLSRLPPLTGLWLPRVYPLVDDAPVVGRSPPPVELKPDALAQARALRESVLRGDKVERGYCEVPAFGGWLPMNVGGTFEIIYSPGRVTLATEGGIVRRVFLPPARPPSLAESRGGASTGRWEGNTLIVETTGLRPSAWLVQGVPVGRNVHVVERFSLVGTDDLRVETTVDAPDVLSRPMTAVNEYRRAPAGREFTDFDTCTDDDRSFDRASRQERFEATPPDDLPPPPSD